MTVTQWRRPGAEFGGDAKFFADLFPEKISVLTAKIYDHLFLVIDQVFRIFRISSPNFRIFYYVQCRTTTFSEKNSFMTPFLLCSYFRAHPTTLLLKILGGRMYGPSPTSNFWGDRPPIPPFVGLRPCHQLTNESNDCFNIFTGGPLDI